MTREWLSTEWGELATLEYGRGLRDYQNSVGQYRVYGTNGPIGWHDQALCNHPSVIIGRKGAYRGVHFSHEPFFAIDTAFYLEPKVDLDIRWAYYQLLTVDINGMDSGSAIPSTSREAFYRIPVAVPPLPEQRAIAAVLGALDDKIELNRRMNATLEGLARALFKAWFVDFEPVRAKMVGRPTGLPAEIDALFPDEMEVGEEGVERPRGWRIGAIGDIADVVDCLHSKKPERREIGQPLLQLWNIRDDGLIDMKDTYFVDEVDYERWISRLEASPGDCVITNVGRVGAAAQIPEGLKAALGRNMTAVRCRSEYPFPTFLLEALISDSMQQEIAHKTDTGTILDALNVRNIPRLRIALAPKEVLRQFETAMRPLRARMERNLAQSTTLAALRDTLLPKLMAGEVRVSQVEEVVNDAL